MSTGKPNEDAGSVPTLSRQARQRERGDPNRLSSARSFSPPVGSHVRPGQLGGYYVDFSVKAHAPSWPPPWLAPLGEQVHVATAQWGLGCYERYLSGDGDAWLDVALEAADHLVTHQERGGVQDGGWVHGIAMPHTYALHPPWLSAMAQGEGASLLVRMQAATGSDRYGEAAVLALRSLDVSTREGGLRVPLGDGFFLEEYPTDPPSLVLNGGIFALWGYYDVAVALSDADARREFDAGVESLAANLHRWDTGSWSLYDLFPHRLPNVASSAYHALHTTQLRAMNLIAPRPELAGAADRFQGYSESRRGRTAAFARKAAFRVLVPRNRLLAHRTPFRHRATSEALVLCYHAVSELWEADLSVTPDALAAQLGLLVDRGYRGVTFQEAVNSRPPGRTVAVTFDDAYSSVLDVAFPILAGLGLPATVFVPTRFAGVRSPMSWPGIDDWLGGPHERELSCMSWEELGTLADAGWEVGSHTHSHPRLPALDDERLALELELSHEICSDSLGTACRSLAYPYGDHDARVIAAARAAGYRAAGTLPARLHPPEPMRWPRIGIYRGDTDATFRAKVSPAMRRLRASRGWDVVSRVRGQETAGT
jgi:peptidoglycan/xylan/chitin deacetylase (PgdA/CDA1 family)